MYMFWLSHFVPILMMCLRVAVVRLWIVVVALWRPTGTHTHTHTLPRALALFISADGFAYISSAHHIRTSFSFFGFRLQCVPRKSDKKKTFSFFLHFLRCFVRLLSFVVHYLRARARVHVAVAIYFLCDFSAKRQMPLWVSQFRIYGNRQHEHDTNSLTYLFARSG